MDKIVGTTFKENGRVYYFSTGGQSFQINTEVIVETEKGLQYAKTITPIKEVDENTFSFPLKKIVRIVTEGDKVQYTKNLDDASKALIEARKLIEKLGLKMRMIDASFTFDRNQLLFNFLADERIDFRELAKRLAQIYKTRIELRQIGVRDKAKEIGGLGPCGRFLCCNQFLTDFNSVSINMAKNQYISLNPTKINGVCGRLLCCLKYEDDVYTELKKGMPVVGEYYNDPEHGSGRVTSVQVLKRTYTVDYKAKGTVDYKLGEEHGSN